MPEPVPVLLDRHEAATRLRVSVRTIRRYGKLGLLENVHIGRREVRVTESSVAALIAAGRNTAA